MLLLTKSYFSTFFFPFYWLYVISKVFLGTDEEHYAEQQAWTQWDAKHEAWMSIFSRDCSIYTNYKTFLISDLQYKIDMN